MPFLDDYETLRVGAGVRVSVLAKEANLSRDTLRRIKNHQNVTHESLVSTVNALNNLHYGKNGSKLDHTKLITSSSRFGGNE